MSVRDFMRGGYRDLTEPTVVANHGRPVFTVFPHNQAETVTYGMSDGPSLSSTSGATLQDRREQPPRTAGVTRLDTTTP